MDAADRLNPSCSDGAFAGELASRAAGFNGAAAVVVANGYDPGGAFNANAGTAYLFTHGLPGVCTDPARPEGVMLYNNSSKVMQYCDGVNRVGIEGIDTLSEWPRRTGITTVAE